MERILTDYDDRRKEPSLPLTCSVPGCNRMAALVFYPKHRKTPVCVCGDRHSRADVADLLDDSTEKREPTDAQKAYKSYAFAATKIKRSHRRKSSPIIIPSQRSLGATFGEPGQAHSRRGATA